MRNMTLNRRLQSSAAKKDSGQSSAGRKGSIPNYRDVVHIIFALVLALLLAGVCFADGWTRTYGGSDSDWGNSVAQTSDGGYIIAGIYDCDYYAGTGDVYLIKTDSLGLAGIDERAAQKPRALTITAFPNPFNSSCEITAPAGAGNLYRNGGIEIYDLRGNVIATPFGSANAEPLSPLSRGTDQSVSDGQGVYIWHPDKSIPSGIYLIRATVNNRTITKRAVLIK